MDKSEISRLREVPLEAVLERFGAQRDPQDPKRNWRTHAGRITLTEGKFFNHDQEQGGGGSIDLVMHLGSYKFKEAVAWLGGNIGREAAIQQYQVESEKHVGRILDSTPTPKLEIPLPEPVKLDRVKRYLTEKRGIPSIIVENAIDKGRLWADKHANAVFSLRDLEGNPVGAELRGTFDKPFHGVRGEKGLFFTGNASTKTAVFVESGIDALSYQALHPQALAISTAGSTRETLTAAATLLKDKGFKLVAGFDNDQTGDRLAEVLNHAAGEIVERQRPAQGKDWNDQLKGKTTMEKLSEAEKDW